MSDPRVRGRRNFLLMAGMFFVPVVAAFILYYTGVWRPTGTSAKGQLIQPPVTLQITGLRQADGNPIGQEALKGKWSLIYIGDGRCDDPCRTALTYGRQSRLALNNEMTRVQRVFLVTGTAINRTYLDAEQPGIVILDATSSEAAKFLAQFPAERARSLFIVDPNGNLMMRHDARVVVNKDLLTDLKKLLKLSHIG